MATRQYVTFTLGEHLFGIDVLLVREINPTTDFTPVDLAPEFVRGLMNLRGQIVTIIDPGVRLGMGRGEITPRSRCVVLKTSNEVEEIEGSGGLAAETVADSVGLLVDSIGDMVPTATKNIEPPPANIGEIDGKYIAGVVKLDLKLMLALKTREVLRYVKA
jgi:purine-binding chemotaxis protein CheW